MIAAHSVEVATGHRDRRWPVAPPTSRGMTENITISAAQPGDELRFHGLRLGRGPIRMTVRCRSENFLICDYRVGGVGRHLVVDLVARTRRPVSSGRVRGRASMSWCRDLLVDLEAGRVPASPVAHPLDLVAPASAA